MCNLRRISIMDFISNLKDTVNAIPTSRIEFDSDRDMSDQDNLNLTGLSKRQLEDLCQVFPRKWGIHHLEASRHLLAYSYWIWNLASRTIFNISKSSLRRAILPVRKTLMSSIVPNYLGFEHTTRRLQRPSSCENHIIYSSSGYVISILRPFFAEMKNKDATMLNHALMRNTDTIRQWVQE